MYLNNLMQHLHRNNYMYRQFYEIDINLKKINIF